MAAEKAAADIDTSPTLRDLFTAIWPELYGEVELDLAAAGLIPNLDDALESRTWHYIRTAILRLIRTPGSWVREELDGGRIRRGGTPVQDPGSRSGSLQEGSR